MRNILIIGGVCVVVIGIGVWLYFQSPAQPQPTTMDANATTEVPTSKEVHFKVLDQGSNAADMPLRKNYAIYDVADFATFWKKAHNGDGVPMPTVDFDKNYVIGVFAGTEPSGGYSIAVDTVTDTGNARSVSVIITEPGDTCTVIEELTSPYQFVVVPISDAEALAHTDVRTTKDCR